MTPVTTFSIFFRVMNNCIQSQLGGWSSKLANPRDDQDYAGIILGMKSRTLLSIIIIRAECLAHDTLSLKPDSQVIADREISIPGCTVARHDHNQYGGGLLIPSISTRGYYTPPCP